MKKKGSMRVSAILLSLFMVCTMIAPTAFAEDNGGQGGEQPPAVYSIEVKNVQEAIQGGSVTVEPTSAEEGKEVKVTVSLLEGYKVKSLKAVKSDNTGEVGITERDGARYFTMPNTNVRVEVEYEAPPTPEPTPETTPEPTPETTPEPTPETTPDPTQEVTQEIVDDSNTGNDEYSDDDEQFPDVFTEGNDNLGENNEPDGNMNSDPDAVDPTNDGEPTDVDDTNDENNVPADDGNDAADTTEGLSQKGTKVKLAKSGAKGLLGAGEGDNNTNGENYLTIDFGEGHEEYAGTLQTEKIKVSGHLVSIPYKLPADGTYKNADAWNDAVTFIRSLGSVMVSSDRLINDSESGVAVIGLKSRKEYADTEAVIADYDAYTAKSDAFKPNAGEPDFYAFWEEPVGTIEITIPPILCGQKLTAKGNVYTPEPAMTVKGNAAITEKGWFNLKGNSVVLTGGEKYNAGFILEPHWGYYLPDTVEEFKNSLQIVGATLEDAYIDGGYGADVVITAEHDWDTPEYDWDKPEFDWSKKPLELTASRKCKNTDCTAMETETVGTTSTVKQKATCTVPLITTYTSAAFENTAFTVQTKDVTGKKDANAHEWKAPVYTWNKAADGTMTVTATRECGHDATHKETETVSAASKVVKAATCTEKGETTYTSATFKNTAFQTQTKTEAVAALGHAWGEPTYEWLESNTKVKATRTCSRCEESETETVGTEDPVISPTPSPTTKGIKTYKSKAFTNPAFTVQTKQVALVMYTCTEGGGKTWTKGSNVTKDFTFKRNFNDNETFGKFKSIQVNGKALAESSYKVEAGSLKVYLQPAYLETLSAGTYTMEVQFTDGRASTRFGVVTQAANKNAAGTAGKATTTTGSAARTGDTSHMVLWLILMIVAAAGCGIGVYLKKRSK